jgi:hypothetical protein
LKRKEKNDENFEGKTNFVFSEILQKKERKKERAKKRKVCFSFKKNDFGFSTEFFSPVEKRLNGEKNLKNQRQKEKRFIQQR